MPQAECLFSQGHPVTPSLDGSQKGAGNGLRCITVYWVHWVWCFVFGDLCCMLCSALDAVLQPAKAGLKACTTKKPSQLFFFRSHAPAWERTAFQDIRARMGFHAGAWHQEPQNINLRSKVIAMLSCVSSADIL